MYLIRQLLDFRIGQDFIAGGWQPGRYAAGVTPGPISGPQRRVRLVKHYILLVVSGPECRVGQVKHFILVVVSGPQCQVGLVKHYILLVVSGPECRVGLVKHYILLVHSQRTPAPSRPS